MAKEIESAIKDLNTLLKQNAEEDKAVALKLRTSYQVTEDKKVTYPQLAVESIANYVPTKPKRKTRSPKE